MNMFKTLSNKFKHINIRRKLILSFMAVFFLTAVVAVTGLISQINTRRAFSYMINYPYERHLYYSDAKYQLMSLRYNFIYMTVIAGDERALKERLDLSSSTIDIFINDLQLAQKILLDDPLLSDDIIASQSEAIDYIINGVCLYKDNHLIPFCELMMTDDVSQAEIQSVIYRGIAIINPFVEVLNEMLVSAEITIRTTQEMSDALSLSMLWLLIAIALVSVVITLFLAVFVADIISKPIVKLVEIAGNVANGNLDVNIDIESQDETGILSKRFAYVIGVIKMFIKDLHDLGHAFKIDGDTTVRLNESQYKGTYAQVASAMNDILEYHVVSKDEILECISNIVDGEYDAPLRQFPGRESRINVSVDILRINVRRMEQIMIQKAESDAANKAKSSFLANMSHEIRTPMNAILGVTELLLHNDQLPDEIAEGLSRIYSSCDLLLGIINDILDFSKIEAGKLDILPAQYKIASMINDSIQLNLIRIESKPIEFELIIDENLPANLIGDELRNKQILNNLLSNAFKYTDSGKVTMTVSFKNVVSAIKTADTNTIDDLNKNGSLPAPDTSSIYKEKEGITLVISIEDTGHGMTQEQLEKLFIEYSRFHQKVNRTIEGTGLGLSITLSLVELMGGDINVESEPGKGSIFTVEIPQMTVDSEVLGKEVADNLRKFRLKKPEYKKRSQIVRDPMPYGTVLIVDDVETNLFVAEGLMRLYKLNIETVISGKDAINKVKEGKVYDIIFMDHMMPEMDGIEAVKHIRDSGYERPIVALTANAVSGQADLFLRNGFDDFISKPIDVRRLDTVLNKFVRDKQPPEVIASARENAASQTQSINGGQNTDEDSYSQINALLMDSFARDAFKTADLLENLINTGDFKNEDNLKKFTVSVHGIKSSLANIGETELSKIASRLENYGKNRDIASINGSTPDFVKQLRALLEKIEKNKKVLDENSAADDAMDIADLSEKMYQIQQACSDYDRNGVMDIINEITQRSKLTNVVLDNIMKSVLHSDFEQAEKEAAFYIDVLYNR